MTRDSAADTIFARASGAGRAGVAVYRVSGPAAFRIAAALAGRLPAPRRAAVRTLRDEGGEAIDRGLVILFEGPASFTGEDVAEFHLHGSRAVETAFAGAAAAAGARPAEAGEFTRRALLAGKLDLAQAEALADLIDAETSEQRRQAWGQIEGGLSRLAEGWRARLLAVLAPLEAYIDFPDEEDVPAAVAARAGPAIDALIAELRSYREAAGRARRLREGVEVAIIGAPNAGKSSLLNALAGSEIAIVAATAGTTRDIVEARLDLDGIPATLADTAGLRDQTTDEIEAEGMRRALARASAADLRVLVVDAGGAAAGAEPSPENAAHFRPLPRERFRAALAATAEPYLSLGRGQNAEGVLGEGADSAALLRPGDLLVFSKNDLGRIAYEAPADVSAFHVSTKTGEGMAAFLAALTEAATRLAGRGEGAALTRLRHIQAVDKALDALARARAAVETDPELAAEDARLAARALGQITGAVDVEDVLGEIFSSFCIGK